MASIRIRFERQRHRIAWKETAKALNDLARHGTETKIKKGRKESMKKIHVKLTLTAGMLGTSPADSKIYETYIGKNAPNAATLEEEIEALGVDAVAQRGMTVYSRTEDGKPFIYDYMIRGFFKETCGALQRLAPRDPETGRRVKGAKSVNDKAKESCKLGFTTYKGIIDTLIFVKPREIPIVFDGEITTCQRSLRAETMQGPRTATACSEEVPAGATLDFWVICFDDAHIAAVKEWLDHGEFHGLGQWRNSGKGTFTYEVLEEVNGK
jgi:hypothetical protein